MYRFLLPADCFQLSSMTPFEANLRADQIAPGYRGAGELLAEILKAAAVAIAEGLRPIQDRVKVLSSERQRRALAVQDRVARSKRVERGVTTEKPGLAARNGGVERGVTTKESELDLYLRRRRLLDYHSR